MLKLLYIYNYFRSLWAILYTQRQYSLKRASYTFPDYYYCIITGLLQTCNTKQISKVVDFPLLILLLHPTVSILYLLVHWTTKKCSSFILQHLMDSTSTYINSGLR